MTSRRRIATSRIVLFESYLALELKARKFGLNNQCAGCPLWVKSAHVRRKGHVRFTPKSRHVQCTSAHVCFGPKADISLIVD
jgi:hypothetical protein